MHLYEPLLRPAGFATAPSGWEYVERPASVMLNRPDLPQSRLRYGVIGYREKLSDETREHYSLRYIGGQ